MAERKPSFASVLAKASKKYDTQIGSLSTVAHDVEVISSGNIAIDHIFGVGGLPRGRLIELYGPASCGKTTLALQAAAEFQKRCRQGDPGYADKVILYMDHENAMDPTYAKALGLDVEDADTFLFAQPSSLEQSANISRELVATGHVGLVIFDSVAAMVPQAALDAETGKASVALQARLMSDFLKVFIEELYRTNTTAIFLNHIAEVIDMGGGGRPGMKRYTTPGGRALKFYSSVRAEFHQIKNIQGEVVDDLTQDRQKVVQATDVKVKVVKNKVGPPFRQAIVRVRYGQGFDNGYTAVQILKGRKLIREGTGGWFYFDRLPTLAEGLPLAKNGRPYIRGLPNVYKKLDSDPAWAAELLRLAVEALNAEPEPLDALDAGDDLDVGSEEPEEE